MIAPAHRSTDPWRGSAVTTAPSAPAGTTAKRLGEAPDPASLDPAERMGVDELRALATRHAH